MRGNRAAVKTPRFVREPFDKARAIGDFAARLGQRLALLQRENRSEVVLMAQDQFVPAQQQRRTFSDRQPTPRRECVMSGVDGFLDLCGVEHRHMAEHFLIGRVMHGHGRGCGAMHPASADIAQRFE